MTIMNSPRTRKHNSFLQNKIGKLPIEHAKCIFYNFIYICLRLSLLFSNIEFRSAVKIQFENWAPNNNEKQDSSHREQHTSADDI